MIVVNLCYPILPCVRVNMNSSYIKSFAVDKLLAVVAPKTLATPVISLATGFRLGGLSAAAAAYGGGSGD